MHLIGNKISLGIYNLLLSLFVAILPHCSNQNTIVSNIHTKSSNSISYNSALSTPPKQPAIEDIIDKIEPVSPAQSKSNNRVSYEAATESYRGLATLSDRMNKESLLRYDNLKNEILQKRLELYKAYSSAGTSEEKEAIIKEAGDYLFDKAVNGLIPFWRGTKWDFDGYSTVPGEGKVACGHFVSVILKHLGFNIPKNKFACETGEFIIKNLTTEGIYPSQSETIETLLQKIKEQGNGLYIIGLSKHVGFIDIEDREDYFIHSSYLFPDFRVVKEKVMESGRLVLYNDYILVGKIIPNTNLTISWLKNERINIQPEYDHPLCKEVNN